MRRGKPQQQYYVPGSGPLRKSGQGVDDAESDTNLVMHSRHNQGRNDGGQNLAKIKSEGASPRDRSREIENTAGELQYVSGDFFSFLGCRLLIPVTLQAYCTCISPERV